MAGSSASTRAGLAGRPSAAARAGTILANVWPQTAPFSPRQRSVRAVTTHQRHGPPVVQQSPAMAVHDALDQTIVAPAMPTIGSALDLITSTMTAAKNASEGKDTHLGAKYAQIAKGFLPGGNLWYTKAAMDHLIFQNVQEQLSPGYLGNMRNNTMKQYGQDWWWAPGEFTPERAPNMGAAIK